MKIPWKIGSPGGTQTTSRLYGVHLTKAACTRSSWGIVDLDPLPFSRKATVCTGAPEDQSARHGANTWPPLPSSQFYHPRLIHFHPHTFLCSTNLTRDERYTTDIVTSSVWDTREMGLRPIYSRPLHLISCTTMSRRYHGNVSTDQPFKSTIHGERIPFEQSQRLESSQTLTDALCPLRQWRTACLAIGPWTRTPEPGILMGNRWFNPWPKRVFLTKPPPGHFVQPGCI